MSRIVIIITITIIIMKQICL